MTARGMAKYMWQAYQPNVDALVWTHPVRLDKDDTNARAMVAEVLYRWASVPVDGTPGVGIFYDAQRSAFSSVLAYVCGYTGGSEGPK